MTQWVVMPPLRPDAAHPAKCTAWGTADEDPAETAGRFHMLS